MPRMELWKACRERQHDEKNPRKILLARVLWRHNFNGNEAGAFFYYSSYTLHIYSCTFIQFSLKEAYYSFLRVKEVYAVNVQI